MPEEQNQTQPIETGDQSTQQSQPQVGSNSQAREAIYQRYYGQEPQAAQQPQEQQQAAPTQPDQPAVTPAIPSEFIELVSSLKADIEGLKSKLDAPASATPQTPQPVESSQASDWLGYLQQGEFEKGKQALREEIAKTVGPEIRQQAINETLETFRVQQEATSFINALREKNPEVLPLEDLISVRVNARMDKAKAEGKLNTSQDFLDVYKASVQAEVDAARNIIHQLRADGKNEALVTKREVLSATPMTPQPIDQSRMNPKPQEAQPETVEDYIAKRTKQSWVLRGLS